MWKRSQFFQFFVVVITLAIQATAFRPCSSSHFSTVQRRTTISDQRIEGLRGNELSSENLVATLKPMKFLTSLAVAFGLLASLGIDMSALAVEPSLKSTLIQYKETVESAQSTEKTPNTKTAKIERKIVSKPSTKTSTTPVVAPPTISPAPLVKPVEAKKATVSKKVAPTVSKTVTKEVSSTSTTTSPKLVEEIAVEGAMKKKEAGKARLNELTTNAKKNKATVSSLNSEIKKLNVNKERLESRLKKSGLDVEAKRVVEAERNAVVRDINDRKLKLRGVEKAMERDANEVKSLVNRLQADDVFLKTKESDLKKKKDFLAQQAETKRRQDAAKTLQLLQKEQDKAENALKKTQSNNKDLSKTLQRTAVNLQTVQGNVDAAQKTIDTLQAQLDKEKSAFIVIKGKEKELANALQAAKESVSKGEQEVKAKDTALKAAKSAVERQEKLVKK